LRTKAEGTTVGSTGTVGASMIAETMLLTSAETRGDIGMFMIIAHIFYVDQILLPPYNPPP
jgi:hypothetical protein